jgi:hypothetical protein
MTETRTLPLAEALAAADRITVTDNLNVPLASVDDPALVQRVVTWLGAHEAGWYVPAGGVRVLKVRLNFSGAGAALGNIGLGRRYLTAHHRGQFFQRDADPGDREALLGMLGVDDPEG